MENYVVKEFSRSQIKVIRYADDFVIFGKTLENVQKAEQFVTEFLKPIRLNLSIEKTRIKHSMKSLPNTTGPIGLDFLSYHFVNKACSKHRRVKNIRGVPQKF
jgi:RNA-directed DNA polymerase